MAAWKSLVKPIAEFSTSTGLSVVTVRSVSWSGVQTATPAAPVSFHSPTRRLVQTTANGRRPLGSSTHRAGLESAENPCHLGKGMGKGLQGAVERLGMRRAGLGPSGVG
jgi:hypothetical protein